MAERIIILTPFLNEEESLNRLLHELGIALQPLIDSSFTVLVIDDGSTGQYHIKAPSQFAVKILRLQRNIGHQFLD